MKLHRLFFTFALLCLTLQICFGQEKPQSELIAEFGKICSKEYKEKLSTLFLELNNRPTTKGYVIFYGDSKISEGRNLKYFDAISIYFRFRKMDLSRVIHLRGKNKDKMLTQFWLVPEGADAPKPVESFADNGNVFFSRTSEIYHKDYTGYDFPHAGCGVIPELRDFTGLINSNPDLTGYLITYSKTGAGKDQAMKMAHKVFKKLTEGFNEYFRVPPNRLKTIYGGSRKEPEVEYWLVPKGNNPPNPQKRGQK